MLSMSQNFFFKNLILLTFSIAYGFMGKSFTHQIRDNYTLYSDLLYNRKSTDEKKIDISTVKQNHRNLLMSDGVLLKHITLTEEIIFDSEVKIRNYRDFKFKITCRSLYKGPFFRYDSDGPTHQNYDESIPLKEQSITTPHFHNFNDKGIEIAYKTDQLLNDASRVALEDINLCVAHFCHEGNIRVGESDFPSISILSKTLGLPLVEGDPNSGVNFI
jgi:hypothetical protein